MSVFHLKWEKLTREIAKQAECPGWDTVAFIKWPARFKAVKTCSVQTKSTCEEKPILDELVFELNVF